jgi:hypothetical protein
MVFQAYSLNEIEVGVKDILGCLIVYDAYEQGYYTLNDERIALCTEAETVTVTVAL